MRTWRTFAGVCWTGKRFDFDGGAQEILERGTDCHTSDIGHWFAMTRFLQGVRYKAGGRTEASAPTDGYKKRSTRLGGSSGRPTPTDVLQGMRWGGAM